MLPYKNFRNLVTESSEPMIMMIASIFSLASKIIFAYTFKPWHIYFAAALGSFDSLTSPLIRTILSKAVPLEHIGKKFMSIGTLLY